LRILHTENSWGWGGQEIRILREAEGMRKRGHEVVFAIVPGGLLIPRAQEAGFKVYEINFRRRYLFSSIPRLLKIIKEEKIDIINTHSSKDAWIAGIAGRLAKRKIVRTRHLSTPVKPGFNSRFLYRHLLDYLMTTCSSIIPKICQQSGLSPELARCVATGIEPSEQEVNEDEVRKFREKMAIGKDDILIGTLCFLREWKGIEEFIGAAKILKGDKELKWMIVGGGLVEKYQQLARDLGVGEQIIFTGHMEMPQIALASFDLFLLLSTGHEGISQASLQAAFYEKPLITTTIGGLPEVCIEGETGLLVPPFSSEKVAEAVRKLSRDFTLRKKMGEKAKELVLQKFTMEHTLDQIEEVYALISP
jgi:glycosyltransferase involved in cell wall biosynthesis